jgi:AraC family transcriptional regulator
MKESWISQRCTLHIPGLTVDRHVSKPNELDFSGYSHHLLCLLLSDGNQQRLTRISEYESEKAQTQGEFWICPEKTSGLWIWDSTDTSLMFVINPLSLSHVAEEVGLDTSQVELLTTIGAHDPQIEAIASLFQAALDHGDMGRSLYTESLMQVLLIYLLNHYCAFQPKIQHTEAMPSHQFQSVLDYIHSYLDQPLRLIELAAIVGMSPYHFCRAFKKKNPEGLTSRF